MKGLFFVFTVVQLALFGAPSGFQSIAGEVTYHIDKGGAHVVQSGSKGVAQWDHFSLSKGEMVKFIQENGASTILNQVTGGSLSKICGHIESNGKVLITNPAGILIGKSGRIECAGFLASTALIPEDLFLSGNDLYFKDFGEGEIINLGTIHSPTGDVILLSRSIENSGIIKGKNVILASGSEILLKPEGPIFIQGPLDAIGESQNPYALAIKTEGTITAQKINHEGGKIFLVSEKGKTEVNGTLLSPEGTIHVLGDKVVVGEKSSIDVSAPHGAGEILIGGDKKGSNPSIKNARSLTAHEGGEIHADSYVSGNGGKIILWSDTDTVFAAHITAKAYGSSGDGGFIEISGLKNVTLYTHPDLRSTNGKFGTFLMDPGPIAINNNGAAMGPNIFGTPFIAGQLGLGNYIIDTANGTFIGAETILIGANATLTWSEPTTLELIGGRDIFMESGTTIQNTHTGDGNFEAVRMTANGVGAVASWNGITIQGTIQSTEGNIRLTGVGGTQGNSNDGVVVDNGGSIISDGTGADAAQIFLVGSGQMGGVNGNRGVDISSVGQVQSTDGRISFTGTGGGGGSNNMGIRIAQGTVSSTNGEILLNGTASPFATNTSNRGIFMTSNAVISNVNGNISLTGIGGPSSANNNNPGIALNGGQITNANGQISLTGTGGGEGSGNNGIVLQGGTVTATTGSITVDGTGSPFATGDDATGITLNSGVSVSAGGLVSLSGLAGENGGDNNHGILIDASATVSGGLTLSGRGRGVGDNNTGVTVRDSASLISTAATPLCIEGQGGPSGGMSYGVAITDAGTVVQSSNSPVEVVGISGGTEQGILFAGATVTSNDSILGEAFSDITINEGAILTSPGPISLTASRDLIIQGGDLSAINTQITSGGAVSLIAGRNLSLLNGATSIPTVTAGQNALFVVDNQFPSFPDRGPGGFTIESDALVTAGSEFRIYTVRPSQNMISAPLNGGSFTPGSFGVDTTTEKWGLYFNDGPYGGSDFTLYYKVDLFMSEMVASDNSIGQVSSFFPVIQFGQLPKLGFNRPFIYHGHFYPPVDLFIPYRAFIFEDGLYWTDAPSF